MSRTVDRRNYEDAIDGFPRGTMTAEAAAFLYLAEGVEEIRGTRARASL